jgi:NAD dependent epimerase/dehydratase family enzyme
VSISAGKVVIAGGSGFLGQALSASLLQDGYEVVILGRSNKSGLKGEFVKWDAKTMGSWSQQLEGALALFNLTGRSIDCRYTEKNKALILNSRVDSTQILGEAITNCDGTSEGLAQCQHRNGLQGYSWRSTTSR